MLFLRSYVSFSTFYHAGNSSSHSFGWPPVLVSFSVWSSVIHSISFFYHLFLYCSPMPIFVVFPQATPSKDKLNTKAGPYCDQIQGTYFLSSFLSTTEIRPAQLLLQAAVVPFCTQQKSAAAFKTGMTLTFLPAER